MKKIAVQKLICLHRYFHLLHSGTGKQYYSFYFYSSCKLFSSTKEKILVIKTGSSDFYYKIFQISEKNIML